jgi:hypothetical protein
MGIIGSREQNVLSKLAQKKTARITIIGEPATSLCYRLCRVVKPASHVCRKYAPWTSDEDLQISENVFVSVRSGPEKWRRKWEKCGRVW